MARKPPAELKPSYAASLTRRERAYRKQHGLPENAPVPRSAARGHKPKEHVSRAHRKEVLGETPNTSADYRFLRKQRERSPYVENRIIGRRADGTPLFINETPDQRFERTKKAYLKLNREDRDRVRRTQRRLEKRYERAGKPSDYSDKEFYDAEDGLDLDFDDDLTPILFYK